MKKILLFLPLFLFFIIPNKVSALSFSEIKTSMHYTSDTEIRIFIDAETDDDYSKANDYLNRFISFREKKFGKDYWVTTMSILLQNMNYYQSSRAVNNGIQSGPETLELFGDLLNFQYLSEKEVGSDVGYTYSFKETVYAQLFCYTDYCELQVNMSSKLPRYKRFLTEYTIYASTLNLSTYYSNFSYIDKNGNLLTPGNVSNIVNDPGIVGESEVPPFTSIPDLNNYHYKTVVRMHDDFYFLFLTNYKFTTTSVPSFTGTRYRLNISNGSTTFQNGDTKLYMIQKQYTSMTTNGWVSARKDIPPYDRDYIYFGTGNDEIRSISTNYDLVDTNTGGIVIGQQDQDFKGDLIGNEDKNESSGFLEIFNSISNILGMIPAFLKTLSEIFVVIGTIVTMFFATMPPIISTGLYAAFIISVIILIIRAFK